MLPILLGASFAAASDGFALTGYFLAGGLGVLLGSRARGNRNTTHQPRHNTSNTQSTFESAQALQQASPKKLKPVLQNLEDESIKAIEGVLDESHKTRLKLNALTEAFDTQTQSMQKTTEHLGVFVERLNASNKTSTETMTGLSDEITALEETISGTSQQLEHTLAALSTKEEALNGTIKKLNATQASWEKDQLQYHAKVGHLNALLEKTHHQIKDQIAREAEQEAQIKSLQESVKTLTHYLNEVTQAKASQVTETQPTQSASQNNLSFF